MDAKGAKITDIVIRRSWRAPLLLISLGLLAQAHVGSPDIYLDGKAGPYQLFVTIRPPTVIPGVAQIEEGRKLRASTN